MDEWMNGRMDEWMMDENSHRFSQNPNQPALPPSVPKEPPDHHLCLRRPLLHQNRIEERNRKRKAGKGERKRRQKGFVDLSARESDHNL